MDISLHCENTAIRIQEEGPHEKLELASTDTGLLYLWNCKSDFCCLSHTASYPVMTG